MHSLDAFSTWLSLTRLSQAIQTVDWIIPTVQTVHILAVAAVIAAVLMFNLRLIGVGARDQTIAAVAQRFLPFVWPPIAVLLLSGAVLITAEPARSLENPVFLLKMVLLVAAGGCTLGCQTALARNAVFWEVSRGRRWAGRLIASISLLLWVAVIFCGRWIAYIQET